MTDSGFTFVRFGQAHAALMHEWLRRSHVAEWWKETPSVEEIVAEYVTDRDVDAYVVHLDGRPVGFANPVVTAVQVDPRPENARAIRCYEKVGFRPIRVIDTPDGPALYMILERSSWRSG